MPIDRRTVGVMFVASGAGVANLYYCQPLLSEIGRSLGVSDRAIGYLPMWTQAGVALGMFAFVPLGDMFPRRKLIVIVCALSGSTVATMAMAPNLILVNAAGFATGLGGIVAHLILPFAAKLAPVERRGHVVGIVFSGLLLGILLARVVSGLVGDLLGWRAMYWIAAVVMFTLAVTLRYALPYDRPEQGLRYGELARSIVHLAMTQPVLRESAFIGAMLFGAFSSFWATLVFFLATPPYHYGARVAGIASESWARVGVLFLTVGGKDHRSQRAGVYGDAGDRDGNRIVPGLRDRRPQDLGACGRRRPARSRSECGARGESNPQLRADSGGAKPVEYGLHGDVFSGRGARVRAGGVWVVAVGMARRLRGRRDAAAGGSRGGVEGWRRN